ncbi:MAG: hypothetical protein R6V19_09265 [Armatimonadota bacterium]
MAFKAGAARSNLTPPLGTYMSGFFNERPAADVHDELFAKAIVLKDDTTAIAIVVCDLILAEKDDLDRAKARARELTGIPEEHIFISCTHTHYGPAVKELTYAWRDEEYVQWAMRKTGDAVKLAQNRLQPALMGHASAECAEETHNRRWHMKDGSVQMNPGFQNPDALRPAGPKDPEIGLVVLTDMNERPLAVLANYALHFVGSGDADAISANYFGAFDRALQRMTGDEFVGVMANGCCGDINNHDFTRPKPRHPHPHYQVERVADVVAARTYAAWRTIRDYRADVSVAAHTEMMEFTRRQSTEEELNQAREYLETGDREDLRRWAYANEIVELAREPVTRPTHVMGIRIGDVGIIGLPGEMFCDYGLQIKARSPFERTLTVELANDYLGYCPTDAGLKQGGYETQLSRFAKAAEGTEGETVDTAVAVLENLAARRS